MKIFDIISTTLLSEKSIIDKDIEIIKNDATGYKANFYVGDEMVSLNIDVSNGEADVLFIVGNSVDMLNIGYRHARTVIDTVFRLTIEYIKSNRNNIKFINFYADGKSRLKTYDRLERMLIDIGYVDRSVDHGNWTKDYILIRDDVVDEFDSKYK